MARLIPDFIDEECKSNAERRLFTRFKDELPDNFTVLHSLGVAKHRYKPYAEADFVLVHADAVIVIEVKGGRVSRRDGWWFFTDRFGQSRRRRESPMQQAASVAVALRNTVVERFGNSSPHARVAFGSVTVFPDVSFNECSPDWDLRRVFDVDAWPRPVHELIMEAINYSREEVQRITRYEPGSFEPNEVAELLHFLRGNFDRVPSLNVSVEEYDERMIPLAKQQYAILDRLSKNKRMLIEGSAGTGKTLLAIESARRHAAQGRRVLFVCFNRLLADHLEIYMAQNGLTKSISLDTLHSHCLSVLHAANIKTDPEISKRELYAEYIPKLIPDALTKLQTFQPWDVLIVDEGQDIAAHPPFAAALDKLFLGGFAAGKWVWFEDSRQRVLTQGSVDTFDLNVFAPAHFELTRNWRNTNEVATFTSVSTMTHLPELSGIEGPKVTTINCDGTHNLLKLHGLVADLIKEGARPEQIVLLTAVAECNALFATSKAIAGLRLVPFDAKQIPSSDALRFSSVFRFKGLESKLIILTDVSDLHSERARMQAYVGMSRANCALYILLTEQARRDLAQNRLNFADLNSQVRALEEL